MARKKKTQRASPAKAKNAAQLHRVGTPPAKKRKSSGCLTLMIMGGAAFFGLRACSDTGNNERFYTSVAECARDGNTVQGCNDAWKAANNVMTPGKTPSDCRVQYDTQHCFYDAGRSGWLPVMSGFLLSKAQKQKEEDNTCNPQVEICSQSSGSHVTGGGHYAYSRGGSQWVSRPVWRDRSGKEVYPTLETDSRTGQLVNKTKTLSRGGWGSSTRSFSSRGG